MKTFAIAGILALAASVAQAQEREDVTCRKGRRGGSCCTNGRDARPWEGLGKGVKWESSLDEARRRAAAEGKPVLLYQLVGDLDKEGC